MQQLLPHYERELAFLRRESNRFARSYPRIAAHLADDADAVHDPHVDRLLQAFALLSSRIHKRLDDDFPLFTQWLLQLLYPHGFRPFPSCSIACFDLGPAVDRLRTATALPRGTELVARPVRRVACRFTTTAEVQLLPLRVVSAGFRTGIAVPDGTPVPRQATALLSLHIELGATALSWRELGTDRIRLFLNGEPSLATLLRETLSSRVVATLIQTSPQSAWQADTDTHPLPVGLDEIDALIDLDARSHQASRLLTEYFAFPEKFNFIDLCLPPAALQTDSRQLGLHFALTGPRDASDAARLLELATAANFVIGCVPVINLFRRHAAPIRLNHRTAMYTVLPDAYAAATHDVYAIDRVTRIHETPEGTSFQPAAPLHALRHEASLRGDISQGLYWYTQRNNAMASKSPGHETEIGLVDLTFDPAATSNDTLSIELRATQGELPCRLSIGHPDGDLCLAGGGEACDERRWQQILLVRKPTPPRRFDIAQEGLWQLLSQLSLSHLALSGASIDGLKELLRLHDLSRSAHAEHLLQGLVDVQYRPARAGVVGNPFTTTVQGTEIFLIVDEQHFVGSGLHLFAQVLERCVSLHAQLNTFTQLRVVSAHTGEVLVCGARRSGDNILA